MAISVPQWLEGLIEDSPGAGLHWYRPDEREARFAEARGRAFDPGYQWITAESVDLAAALLKDKLAVGESAPITTAPGRAARVRAWLDLRAPDQLWLGLDQQPPFLWFSAGRTVESVRRALDSYLPGRAPGAPDPLLAPPIRLREAQRGYQEYHDPAHDRACRLLLGVALDDSDLDLVQVENHLTVNPFCEAEFLFQGTAHWNTQENPTVTIVRTAYSRSVVRLLWYEGLAGTLFAAIDYTAAAQEAAIAAYNRQFDFHFPTDLPVDVPAMLLGFEATDVAELQRQMEEIPDPGLLNRYLEFLGILSFPHLEPYLQPYSRHPIDQVRRTVVTLAETHDLRGLLRGMLESESNSLIRARIEAALTA